MSAIRRFWRKIQFFAQRRRFERELAEEMQFHSDMLHGDGRRFGNATLMRETSREMWAFTTIESLMKDVQYAFRMLRRSPVFASVAVVSLALGIGANTAIFSLIDALMLKALPVDHTEQLVELLTVRSTSQFNAFSYQTYGAIREGNHVFTDVFASKPDKLYVVVEGAEPERVDTQFVTDNFFTALGVKPYIGRFDGGPNDAVAVISYSFWKQRFGLNPAVLGRKIVIEEIPFTIAGVTPPGFYGVQAGRPDDISIPLAVEPRIHHPSWMSSSGYKWLRLMARLKTGVPLPRAHAEVSAIFKRMLADELKGMKDAGDRAFMSTWTADVVPARAGLSQLQRQFSGPLTVLSVIVGLVLLIACANVANLLLARANARQREISIRRAIGAGRIRLLRQMLTESAVLAALGGSLGLALAWWGSNYLVFFMGTGRDPVKIDVHVDGRMLAFTAAVSLVTAILFGLAPALRSSDTLRLTQHRHRLGKVLVVTQVVVSVLLLAGAGLFARTLVNLETLDTGFDRSRVLLAGLDSAHSGYTPDQRTTLYKQLLEEFRALPGVRSASVSWIAPIAGGGSNRTLTIDGRLPSPEQHRSIYVNWVSPKYFETLGTPLLVGRDFRSADDQQSTKVAVINESMARLFFGNENPLGQRVVFGPGDLKQIVGVVKDTKYLELRESPTPTIYLDTFQEKRPDSEFELRCAGDTVGVVAAVRRKVHDLTKGRVGIRRVSTLTQQVDASIVRERLIAMLSSVFGVMGLLLACIGLYGLLAYAVARRSREIGIRMALGADRRSVVGMVLREAVLLAGIGVMVGIPAALVGARWVTTLLYGVTAHDPLTMTGAASVLLLVAFLAAWIPSRRASRVDPMVALRYE